RRAGRGVVDRPRSSARSCGKERELTAHRLTVAQALVRAMAAQWAEVEGERRRLFAGVWAIFGHGNVAALGEALFAARDVLPTLRAHNEQAWATPLWPLPRLRTGAA